MTLRESRSKPDILTLGRNPLLRNVVDANVKLVAQGRAVIYLSTVLHQSLMVYPSGLEPETMPSEGIILSN